MATIQGGKITTEVVNASYPKRTPGHMGVDSNINSPRAGGPSSESEANLPRARTPGHLGRTGATGPLGTLRATGMEVGNGGPQKIMALKGQSHLTSTMGPGSNSLPESGKLIRQQRAQPKSGSSLKK